MKSAPLEPPQRELFEEGVDEARAEELKALLAGHDWLTRKQIMAALGWNERDIRNAAEVAGDAVVRGPRGFALFEKAGSDEALHCARIAEAQASKMQAYACRLRARVHQRASR